MRSTSIETWRGFLEAHAEREATKPRGELPVVTISREALAGATTVAQLAADRLNQGASGKDCPWTVFDRNLVEKVLQEHELPKHLHRFMPEDAQVFSPAKVLEELLGLHPSDWKLVHHTTDTILRLARLGNVILVGRGSNVITAGRKRAFHVRLVAPIEVRIQRAVELYQVGESEAAALVKQRDRASRRYVKQHFHVANDDPLQYHAVYNTGKMSLDAVARVIAEAVSAIPE